jgi:protein-disulfide isomerase
VLKTRFYAVLASAAMIAALAFAVSAPARAEDAAAPVPAPAAPVAATPLPDMAIGSESAPVTIIEYSSLTCPHCANFHKDVYPELKSQYIDTGKVRYVMREFPLNEPALAGAVVARCLDASRYFAFTGLLFAKQADWAFKDDALAPLKAFAKQAGMTGEEFDKCIDNQELQKKILAVRDEGQKKGVNATPSFFVNGMLLKGAPTLKALEEAMKPYLGDK